MIDNLIKNCLGLSKGMDATMTMLAAAVEDADKARLLQLVEELKGKLHRMHQEIKDIRLGYENRNVTNERVESYRANIRSAFLKNPQAIYWYEHTLTENFFSMIEEPEIRLAIINEVTLQASSRFPNFVRPELWMQLVAAKGLMNKE